ncbi:MAG TPA: MFS transporter [Solirubrobacteraceae bacterium]|nr:MFS transporter [Solirubrobacteraceae bacterium]
MSVHAEAAQGSVTGTIKTKIPARLDRLPWARFHWMIVAGLGTVWILDGLEVTNVGSVASRMTEKGSGIAMNAGDIGTAAAIYVIGACLGALFFGQLTDRFGRKRLFMITLGVYIVATTATAFSFAPWFFFLCRFVTGAGIGGEYASINSAIDELIPARARGRVDLTINGSYWLGSLAGSAAALFFLDESIFATNFGWRLSFGVGAVIGLTVLLVRRNVPESPRWLFIHGRDEEAEAIVSGIEQAIEKETGQQLPEVDGVMTVRQRESISFREIARVAFKKYPKRSFLALALFVGQAFIYNGVTFDLGTLFTTFEKVSSSTVPIFLMVFAAGNFAGPLILGRLFDTVGRKPMIAGTYIGSAVVTGVLAILFSDGTLGRWGLEGVIVAAFFLASAGASAAYLTASEIFPMETRALAIAFFYAIGTGLGGIVGPLLFGHLIDSGQRSEVAIAFWIGAGVMALGGVTELFFGVKAEGMALEDIAKPITVEDAEESGAATAGSGDAEQASDLIDPHRRQALEYRRRAEETRAWAAEHRAREHELRAGPAASSGAGATDGGGGDGRSGIEAVLAEITELHAAALDQRAIASDERAEADAAKEDGERDAALERAKAAELRAEAHDQEAEALSAEHEADAELHRALSKAAMERARAREQRSLAAAARAEAPDDDDGAVAALRRAEAERHEAWAATHDRLALALQLRGEGSLERADSADREAGELREVALGAEERVSAAQHRVDAEELGGLKQQAETTAEAKQLADRRERERHERDERIRRRLAERQRRERAGLRRLRPGPGSSMYSPGMLGTATASRGYVAEEDLDREIDVIGRALDEHGATERADLARLVGARYWGPGRFGAALREAVAEGRAQRISGRMYGPPAGGHDQRPDGEPPTGETAQQ